MKSHLPFWPFFPVLFFSLSTTGCGSPSYVIDDESRAIETVGAKSALVFEKPRSGKAVPEDVLSTARELVPGFRIEEAEREVEGGEVSWTFEGTARGREIELEIEENDDSVGR